MKTERIANLADTPDAFLNTDDMLGIIEDALAPFSRTRRVLLIHPDYTRTDCTPTLVPVLHGLLRKKGLEALDTLNSAGTHRKMTAAETLARIGLSAQTPGLGRLLDHEFDNPDQLTNVGELPGAFISEQTNGGLKESIALSANGRLYDGYDLVVRATATKPHEAAGFAGGAKILVPGVVDGNVTSTFHFAAALVGLPNILGQEDNPARRIIDRAAGMIIDRLGATPILLLNMVCADTHGGGIGLKALFAGIGIDGFKRAFANAVAASKRLHFIALDAPVKRVVQAMPTVYDEVWTAGKGSYYVQSPGVLAPDAEVIIFAPHIHAFHSNARLDAAIRQIGYHGRAYVLDFLRRNPGFDLNIASHVINVRGVNEDFRVTLATGLSATDCIAVGLGYRDPATLKREDFDQPGDLWIPHGGLWTYVRR